MNTGEYFKKIENNGAVYFRCTEISAPHGFSTRLGGVSCESHLASMNLGFNLGDDPENVRENYRIILSAIGVEPNSCVYTKQIHSANVLTVTAADAGTTFECDGFVTSDPNVTIGVRTADCVPILFDFEGEVVGACHAGWRGTVAGIAPVTVSKMEALGADKKGIRAAIGAAIHRCCYEVGEDFYRSVCDIRGRDFADMFIEREERDGGISRHADIAAMNVHLLRECGVPAENIHVSPYCTCCEPELFFSHRASHGKRGVMGAFIAARRS